jgi:hypothetical protein
MNLALRTVMVAPLGPDTGEYPTRVKIKSGTKLVRIVLDQIMTIEKRRIQKVTGDLTPAEVKKVKSVLKEIFIDLAQLIESYQYFNLHFPNLSGNTMYGIKSISVFCGSSPGNDGIFEKQAFRLGETLASRNIELVYGGTNIGLMKAVADGALNMGGRVTGFCPGSSGTRE